MRKTLDTTYLAKARKTFNSSSSDWAKAYEIEIIKTAFEGNLFILSENDDNSTPSSIEDAVTLAKNTISAVFEGDYKHVG